MKKIEIYIDGASSSNPGHAGSGFVILLNGEIIASRGFYIGVQTNNVAEYCALIYALKRIGDYVESPEDITIYSDSKLVVNQVIGTWKINHVNMAKLCQRVKVLWKLYPKTKLVWIPRIKNLADKFAKQASKEQRDV
jgi:ribonuclease HI